MCNNRCYAKLSTQNTAILQKPQSVTGSPAQGIFKCKIRQDLLKSRLLSLAKIFKPSKGKFPISKVVQDHRYCEETGVTEEYYSGSTIQEFSLLRIKNFFFPSSNLIHAFPTCCLHSISQRDAGTEFAANQGPVLAQFCPIPVSWACASILDIFAVPGNASVVLLAPPPRAEESVFNQLTTTDSGQHLLLTLNLAKDKYTPLSITHFSHSRAEPGNAV